MVFAFMPYLVDSYDQIKVFKMLLVKMQSFESIQNLINYQPHFFYQKESPKDIPNHVLLWAY